MLNLQHNGMFQIKLADGKEKSVPLSTCHRICAVVWLNATQTRFNIMYDQVCVSLRDRRLPLLQPQTPETLEARPSTLSVLSPAPLTWTHSIAHNFSGPNASIHLLARPLNHSLCGIASQPIALLAPPGDDNYTIHGLSPDCWYQLNWTFAFHAPLLRLAQWETRLFRTPTNGTTQPRLNPQLLLFDSRIVKVLHFFSPLPVRWRRDSAGSNPGGADAVG